MKNVYAFTLRQSLRSGGYRAVTILLALLCFLLPAFIMPLVESADKDSGDGKISPVTEVYVVDNTPTAAVDFNFLSQMGDARYADITYTSCADDMEKAAELAGQNPKSLILALDVSEDGGYRFTLIRTDDTDIAKKDAEALKEYINLYFRLVLCEKAGISYDALAALSVPVQTKITHVTADGEPVADEQADENDPLTALKPVLSYLLPYVNIMLLYFLVLFYGQNVANCVIMEKTSKLMDTFLVAVKPTAMVFGKVFAIITASVLQFLIWVAALVGGFAVGTALVKTINPDSDMALLAFFDMIGEMSGMFSIPGVIVALLIIMAAFALYCGLAAIGGSLASKPEDLSSTNSLFTLVLIVSFFAVLSTGAMTGTMPEAATWYDYVPFTSILVTPSRILLGYVSLSTGCLSLAIVAATVIVCLVIAGRVYRMMSLYKGNPPKPAAIIGMLKNR